jgi:CPA1 family monovalent cation:H+ antiporter
MSIFEIISILISLTALFSYVNHRYIKLPTTIGVMLISLIMSLFLIILGRLGFIGQEEQIHALLGKIDFSKTLLEGMLSFLLFAGALHVNIDDLLEKKFAILTLSTAGVAASTLLVGTLMYSVSLVLHLNLNYMYCLLFGALISPTDPIAVLGILKKAETPRSLSAKITGEALFNDGIGVVVFIAILGFITGEHEVTASGIALLFAVEAIGGILFGFLLGLTGYRILKSIDNYQVEVLVTLGLVTGGYALASALHFSGLLAIVVTGLLIGNYGRTFAMSKKTCNHLDTFWELVDEILNALLFVLIGLEVLLVTFTDYYILAGIIAIPIVLFSRFVSIGIPISLLKVFREFSPNAIKILTWGGLRGGISVALALSLPKGDERDIILTMTYAVVVFSILVQGLTLKYVLNPLRKIKHESQ